MQHDDTNLERLLRQRARGPSRPAGGPNCGDPEMLAAYAEGSLPGTARERFQTHLADCAACQTAVARLVRLAPDQSAAAHAAQARKPAEWRAWMPAAGWRWALPALAGIALVGSMVYYERSRIVQPRELREPAALSINRPPSLPPPATREQALNANVPAREETKAAGVSRGDAETAEVRKEQKPPAGSDERARDARLYAGEKGKQAAAAGVVGGRPAEQARTMSAVGGVAGGVVGGVVGGVSGAPAPEASAVRAFAPVAAPPATPAPAPPPLLAARAEAQSGQQAARPLADAAQQAQVPPAREQRAAETAQKSQTTGAIQQQVGVVPRTQGVGAAQAARPQAAGAAPTPTAGVAPAQAQAEVAAQAQPGPMLRFGQPAGTAGGVGGGAGGLGGAAAAPSTTAKAAIRAAQPALKQFRSGSYTFVLTPKGVQRTDIAGVLQKLLTPPSSERVLDFSVVELNVWVLLPNGRVAHSADAGETWDASVKTGADDASQILFTDAKAGRITTRSGAVLVTSDAGRTWTKGN